MNTSVVIKKCFYISLCLSEKNYWSNKMGVVEQIDIKNRTYYFYKDLINI